MREEIIPENNVNEGNAKSSKRSRFIKRIKYFQKIKIREVYMKQGNLKFYDNKLQNSIENFTTRINNFNDKAVRNDQVISKHTSDKVESHSYYDESKPILSHKEECDQQFSNNINAELINLPSIQNHRYSVLDDKKISSINEEYCFKDRRQSKRKSPSK